MKFKAGEYYQVNQSFYWGISSLLGEEKVILVTGTKGDYVYYKAVEGNSVKRYPKTEKFGKESGFAGYLEHLPNYKKELDTKKEVEDLIK